MIKLKSLNIFWFMVHVDQIQSYLNLKIGLPPVLKAGSSSMKILVSERFCTEFDVV